MDSIDDQYWPEICCLISQVSLTIFATIKICDNRDQFPIKQLGPISTLAVLFCFLFANIVNLIGRIIEDKNGYYDKQINPFVPQCRTKHTQLLLLGILYNILRQLPFVIFSLKTLRVSICFWRVFNRIDVQKIKNCIIKLFRNQFCIIYFSLIYVALLNTIMIVIYPPRDDLKNYFFYEYFCPRQSSILEAIVSGGRLLMLGFVFFLSIWTYQELDFKRFLVIIFLTSNLVFIPRIYLGWSQNLIKTTYHEIYYTSFIVQLLQTIVTSYYCTRKQELNPPPMQGVLESWPAFHNLKLGMMILEDYSIFRDETTEINYHYRCLQSYSFLDELLKYGRIADNFNLKDFIQAIENILQRNDLVKIKLGRTAVILKSKCSDETLELKDVKKIEKILSDFCELVIFEEWKKTRSYQHLRREFISNGDINEKMELFDIPLS